LCNRAPVPNGEFGEDFGSRETEAVIAPAGLHRQAGTTDLATMRQNLTAIGGGHAVTEPVGTLTGLIVRLVSTFHGRYFLNLLR
jgi:hypothetical protein